jgi:hypothetical protein
VPDWGERTTSKAGQDPLGIWIRLPDVPRVPPWRAPVTWRELGEALGSYGITIPGDLQDLLPALRDAKPHYLLLGFPIPKVQGGESQIVYWSALRLPRLAKGNRKGFRDGELAALINDRTRTFRVDDEIPWVRSENWSPTDLSGRGRLSADVTVRRFVIIGGGALGGYVSELLVRGARLRPTVDDLEFWTASGRFGLRVPGGWSNPYWRTAAKRARSKREGSLSANTPISTTAPSYIR